MIEISLNNRSDFSLGESVAHIDKLVSAAAGAGVKTLALTDTMTVSGLPALFSACKKQGIKPIIGSVLRVYRDPLGKKEAHDNYSFFMKVFVRNESGLNQLMQLLSIANQPDHVYYHSRIGLDEVIATLDPNDVYLTTGDFFGMVTLPTPTLRRSVAKLREDGFTLFGEVTPIDSPLFDRVNRLTLDLAKQFGLPLMAGYPTLYADAEGADPLGVMRAIVSNGKLYGGHIPTPAARDHYPQPGTTLVERLKALKGRLTTLDGVEVDTAMRDALEGNKLIAEGCTYTFEKKAPCLPKMADDEFAELVTLSKAGWHERLAKEVFGYKPTPAQIPEYAARLKFELETLKRMGFSGYFLLVRKIVNWSRESGIGVGPGRGSCFLAGHRVKLSQSGLTKAIEDIEVGDEVIAHDGTFQKVVATLQFDRDEEIIELEFDNGVNIKCTKDHKFFTKNRGWVRADKLTEEDEFDDVEHLASQGD